MGLKMRLRKKMMIKKLNMTKDFKKIRFDTDDNLPINNA